MNSAMPRWIETVLPLVIILGGIAIGYAFNMFVGLAVVVLGLGIWISRAIQRRTPREPGE